MLSKLWNSSRPGTARRRVFDLDLLKRFREDTHGGVLVYMGIMLPVLLGVTGLALDASLWYAQKRSVQAIADTAAYSVMLEIERIGDAGLAKIAAKEDAVIYGLDESAGDSITINIPPKFGAYANTNGYYEVIVGQPASIFLAGLLVGDFDTAARAVSGGAAASNPPCLLASDPSMKNAFKVNNGTVSTTGCNIHVNSSDDKALYVANNGTLDADPIDVVGGVDKKGTITSTPNVDMPSIADPLANLATPSVSGCDYTDVSYSSGTPTLQPGVYCGGISLSGSADVEMLPGTYIISGDASDSFSVSGQAAVTGNGITTYFDGDTSLSLNGQGAMDLSAPTSGSYTGMLFHGDPNGDEATQYSITGNGSAILDGIMYFPAGITKINGNGNTSSNTSISAIMARELRFGGNGTLSYHFADDAVLPPILQSKLTLVE